MGRRPQPEEVQNKIKRMYQNGDTQRKIAKIVGISRASVELVLFPDRVRSRVKDSRRLKIPSKGLSQVADGFFNEKERGNWIV